MKKIYYKRLVTLVSVIVVSMCSYGQTTPRPIGGSGSVSIDGSVSAVVNDVKTYVANPSIGVTIDKAIWTVTGGVIQSYTLTSAVVEWTNAGTGTVNYNVLLSSVGLMESSLNVTVVGTQTPIPPPNPIVLSQDCTSAVLQKTGVVPSDEIWYWEGTNSLGMDTTLPVTSDYSITTSGTYYIRAKNINSGLWSPSSGSVSVTLGTTGGTVWYQDLDADNIGDSNVTLTQCSQPAGYVSIGGDLCPNEAGLLSNNGCALTNQFSNENYVYTIVPQIEVNNLSQITENKEALKNITYFDGLGRPIQSIGIRQSGVSQSDIVTHIEYDALGRKSKEYLPYVSSSFGEEGSYRLDALNATKLFYNTEKYEFTLNPYSEQVFDGSPLNLIIETAAPGNQWAEGNLDEHTIKNEYKLIENIDSVYNFRVSYDSNGIPTLVNKGLFTIGEIMQGGPFKAPTLFKFITKNENWSSQQTYLNDNTTQTFKDYRGRVILTRTFLNNVPFDTYYVYDNYNNLSFVISPKVVASDGVSAGELDKLCYQYRYDGKNRLIEKKIPGKGWEYIVYDNLDRPVLTQDANLKAQNKWLFTKYDVFGRVIYTGLYTHITDLSQANMQVYFNTQNNTEVKLYESKEVIGTGYNNSYYSNNNFPNTNIELLTINYYDDYNFNLAGSFNPTTNNTLIYGVYPTIRTKGLTTGSKIKVLATSNWITTVSYYNESAKLIRAYSYNDYLKTTDVISNKLDFVGKIDETTSLHTNTQDNINSTITTTDNFMYDHAGRLIKQTQTLAGHTETIVVNNYDELGQLQSKKVGNTETAPLQTVDYTYNIRGWLKQINNPTSLGSDLFGFKIGYDEGINPLYNGNISQTQWKTANTDNSLKTYDYTYDALNRITSGIDNTNDQRYSLTNVSYDKNGNITHLQRRGHTDNLNPVYFDIMDDLNYYYNGNQLHSVTDSAVYSTGFDDGNASDAIFNNGNDDYIYDVNGNLLSDANKGITNIAYNHLNLPTQVTFNDGNITYIYDATGVKQKKIVSTGATTEYAGNYVYENGQLQFFNTAEGYAEPTINNGSVTKWDYVYQYKDHLGNIRLSYQDKNNDGTITASTEIVEENNYYPFGLEHKGYNNVVNGTENNYKTFQGQELEEELGKNTLAFQWRDYDPAIARFNKIDRFAEKYYDQSPYNFTKNSPIVFTEVKGDSIWVNTGFRKLRYENGKLYNKKGKEVRKGLTNRIANGKSSGSFVGKAVGALNDIANAENTTGTDVISALQSSDNNFVITNASKNPNGVGRNEFKADDRNASYAVAILDTGQGKAKLGGSGGTVYWNPSGGSVLELGGGRGTRPTSNLAHELFHGYDANFGLSDNRPTSTGLKRNEGRASFFENQIRSQLGYPSREFYRTGGTNYRILDSNNKPIQVAPPSITWLNFLRF